MENEQPIIETNVVNSPKKNRRTIIILGAIAVAVVVGALLFYFLYMGGPSRQVLATVNGERISVKQFNKEVAKVEDPLRDMLRETPDRFLDMMVVKVLLLQGAKKQGLSAPPKTYKDTSKDAPSSEESLIAELMKQKLPSPPEVKREEIEAFYNMFKDRMEDKPLDQVAPFIEQFIREKKGEEEVKQFVEELRKNAKIEIDQERLKKLAAKPPESNTEEDFKKAMTSGKPVLVDFGANSCIPCRKMRPILKEIGTEHSGKAKVLVVDVSKFQDLARQHQVQLIPTLVFFDSKGKEVFRHLGAWDKESIVAKLKEIGMGT